ncbi:hypothetical protein [Clostridium sp.]|uniref:hypothetical protein n=1 Tax=Clostridium sp. TaxID=1506 RepID=UPI003217A354
MDRKLKECIRDTKKLHSMGLVYMHDSINLEVEPNYQILCSIVENLKLVIDKEYYLSIEDYKDTLISELALLQYEDYDITRVSDSTIEFMVDIIIRYVDLDEPIFIDNTCTFMPYMNKLTDLYDKSILQIKEGKFPNIIFK